MKRTTTTTHRYDAKGKLVETIIVDHIEDDAVPNTGGWVQPYPNPTHPWKTYQGYCSTLGAGAASGVRVDLQLNGQTFAQNMLRLHRPDDDDGLAGVPAVA